MLNFEGQILNEIDVCVEASRKRKAVHSNPIRKFMTGSGILELIPKSRKSVRPGCEAKIRAKYAETLTARQVAQDEKENFLAQQTASFLTDKKTLIIIGAVIVGVIIFLMPSKS